MREGSKTLRAWHEVPAGTQAVLLAAAYLGIAVATTLVVGRHHGVVALWPSSGLALIALVLAERDRWPLLVGAVAAGAATFNVLDGDSAAEVVTFAVADVLSPLMAAALILAVLDDRRPDLSRVHDIFVVAGAAAAASALSALLPAAQLSVDGVATLGSTWVTWTMGNLTGILGTVPLVLGIPADGRRAPLLFRPVEAVVTVAVGAAIAATGFFLTDWPVLGVALLPVLWASLRLGVIGAAIAMASVGVIVLAATSRGEGTYAESVATAPHAVIVAQSALILAALAAVSLAALSIERQRESERRRRQEEELRRMQRLESLGALAGSIAHDFNNVLALIRGHAELALMRADRDPEEQLRLVLRAVDSGSALARQLLAYGGRQPEDGEPMDHVDLNALATEMHGLLSRLMGRGISLELDIDPGAGTVRGDATQLSQVVLNLVVNAREATPAGGRVTLGTRALDDDRVAIVVSDTGSGMSPEVRARALEHGFTTKSTGSGLGLATVRAIAERHGGRLVIDSEERAGTTVLVEMPRAPLSVPEVPAPSDNGEGVRTATLLLAEDNPNLRTLMRLALSDSGYELLEAADGVEALDVAGKHQGDIDLLVTDLSMPRMNGAELFRRLAERHGGLRVLYVSGDAEDAARLYGTGTAPVLGKPFSLVELAERVREALQHPAPTSD